VYAGAAGGVEAGAGYPAGFGAGWIDAIALVVGAEGAAIDAVAAGGGGARLGAVMGGTPDAA